MDGLFVAIILAVAAVVLILKGVFMGVLTI